MRSEYFWRIRSASALRFSKGCSSLNLDRMVAVCVSDDTVGCLIKEQTCYNVFEDVGDELDDKVEEVMGGDR